MAFVIKCNACSHRIPWKPTEPRPAECPKCWASFGEERADDDVVMPFIRSAKTTQNDKLYRDMEKGSETRMQIAAEYMAGNAQGAVTVNGVTQTGVVPRAGASAISNFRAATGQGPWQVATVK